GDADGRVVFQAQLDEVLHALVRRNRRQRQHIHLARLEGLLGLVLVVGQVPVLHGAGAAGELGIDEGVVVVAGGVGHRAEGRAYEYVEAVSADEDALALVDGGGGLGLRGCRRWNAKRDERGGEEDDGRQTNENGDPRHRLVPRQ